MSDIQRRQFLKGTLGMGVAGLAVSAGLVPLTVYGAVNPNDWPKEAFSKEDINTAIEKLYGQKPTQSDKIRMKIPTIAQNGAVVPVTVDASLPNVTSISLMVAKNPYALVSSYELPKGTLPFVSSRIKMAETSDVIALAMSDGKLYKTSARVKVTIGGCGG